MLLIYFSFLPSKLLIKLILRDALFFVEMTLHHTLVTSRYWSNNVCAFSNL